MVYHITRIVNNSPKAIVLTNPVRDRDRHVVHGNNDDADKNPVYVVPDHPPKIEVIKTNIVDYPTALKKTLNIYTAENNWCFWDTGEKNANTLIAVGEGQDKILLNIPPNTENLELVVSKEGSPSFRAPSPDQYALDFKIQTQEQLMWCWAAASASIANFYERERKPPWTQCEVANLVLGVTYCCGIRVQECNKGVQFYEALVKMGHAASTPGGGLSFFGVQQEIDAGRPILAGLSNIVGGHGVVITGYNNFNPAKPTIEIQDPQYGSKSVCDFNTFPRSYGADYDWVATCRTK
jgi:Papain-like cysteine protease AvrRpt2